MAFARNRFIHDADAHIMELPDCLEPYLSAAHRSQYAQGPGYRLNHQKFSRLFQDEQDWKPIALARHADADFMGGAEDDLTLRKNFDALGAFDSAERSRALDLMGFKTQLLFSSYCLGNFDLAAEGDLDLVYAVSQAHNRMISDFCAGDPRLLAVGFVPLEDFERAAETTRQAIKLGCKALRVPARSPRRHAPSHVALDAVWAIAQEAQLPVVFHIDGLETVAPTYLINGLPPVRDFQGGESSHTSISYLPSPHEMMTTLGVLILDGVLDRFPHLRFGVIEQGASWAPSWMRWMDATFAAFAKNEERLQKLTALPSDIARRQVRITPFCHEDAGWIIANTSEEMVMFASDFPHVEGGRNPVKRFDTSLLGASQNAIDRFYFRNFENLMGAGLAPELRSPALAAA